MDLVEVVKILIPDVDDDNRIYTDEQIELFIQAADGNHFRAASLAVRALSVDEAITYKVIRTDDQSLDGAKTADAIRKAAQELENLARRLDDGESEEFFSIHYPQPQVFAPELYPAIWRRKYLGYF